MHIFEFMGNFFFHLGFENSNMIEQFHNIVVLLPFTRESRHDSGNSNDFGCVLVYRYTKEGNINELRHNSMYGYENKRNSLVYRYTRTAPILETLADNVFNENICKIGHISCPWQQLSRLFNWTIKETLHSEKHKKVAPNVF